MTGTNTTNSTNPDEVVKELLARHVGYLDRIDHVYEALSGWEYRRTPENVERLGLVTMIDSDVEDGDGDSRPVYIVWRVEGLGETRFYRLEGHHTSHVGTEWEGPFRRVQAREKTVLVYEP